MTSPRLKGGKKTVVPLGQSPSKKKQASHTDEKMVKSGKHGCRAEKVTGPRSDTA